MPTSMANAPRASSTILATSNHDGPGSTTASAWTSTSLTAHTSSASCGECTAKCTTRLPKVSSRSSYSAGSGVTSNDELTTCWYGESRGSTWATVNPSIIGAL